MKLLNLSSLKFDLLRTEIWRVSWCECKVTLIVLIGAAFAKLASFDAKCRIKNFSIYVLKFMVVKLCMNRWKASTLSVTIFPADLSKMEKMVTWCTWLGILTNFSSYVFVFRVVKIMSCSGIKYGTSELVRKFASVFKLSKANSTRRI